MRLPVARLALMLVGSVPLVRAHAQGTKPFLKTDVIRLLTAGGLSKRDIAVLVRRNCLAFRPTDRDRADLRAVGADSIVIAAVDECGRRQSAASRGGGGVLRVEAQPTAPAETGTEVRVTVRLVRGSVPQAGTALLLKGSAAIPGGLKQDARAITDPDGMASFRVLAGTAAGAHRLRVQLANGTPVSGGGAITLTTTAAARAVVRATTAPGELVLWEGGPGTGVVAVTVTDARGNPAAGARLELRPSTAALVGAVPGRMTDERGRASFPIAAEVVRQPGEVEVWTGGARIGSFTVRLRRLVLSAQRTGFVAGAEQRGAVGSTLPQPLVFEVRDTAGAPVPGLAVSFAATGAAVVGGGPTDSSGAVRVRVTLGQRTGPAVVMARVRAIEHSVTVHAEPGPAHELAVLRDSAAVTGPLALQSRQPIVLRVVARDSYGNETALTDFTAVATTPVIRLRGATAEGSEGTVTLEPRRSGAGQLELSASGVKADVPLEVTLQGAVARVWAVGIQSNWVGFDYTWFQLRSAKGNPGVAVSVFARRTITPRLSVGVGGGIGSLGADTTGGTVRPTLYEGYARAEFSVLPGQIVSPVLAVAGGGYRLQGGGDGRDIYHTNVFWSAGVGFDIVVSPIVTAEVRAERQWMTDTNQGHVATLWPVGAGVRIAL